MTHPTSGGISDVHDMRWWFVPGSVLLSQSGGTPDHRRYASDYGWGEGGAPGRQV